MISVEELIEALEEASNYGNVIVRFDGADLYARKIEIKDGDVIISADEDANDCN